MDCDDSPLKIHGGDMKVTLFLQCIKNKTSMSEPLNLLTTEYCIPSELTLMSTASLQLSFGCNNTFYHCMDVIWLNAVFH